MKSITTLMTLMILLTAFSLSAQTNVGITAGASFANVTIKSAGVSVSPKLKAGIITGLFIDAPLSANFGFQPALNFVQKGYEIKNGTVKDHLNLNYIEVPLNFVYKAGKNEGFFIGAGPSVAFGISGRDKYTDSDFPEDDSNDKVKFGSGNDRLKGIEFGANALAGYKFASGFIVSGNYNLGLSKINNADETNPDEQGTIKNRYFSIKIGYCFSGHRHK